MHIEQWKKYFEKYRKAAISISVAIAFVIGSLGYCIWQIQSLRAQLYSRGGSLSREVSASWAGKKWASYGDSITEYGGWQEYVTEYFGFAEHLNCGIENTTFTYCDWEWYANADGSYNSRYDCQGVMEAPAGTTVHELYLASEDRISTQLPDDLDLVVIMGGSNDADYNISAPIGDLSYPLDETTFMGAVALTVIRVQRQCPDALVVLASPLSGRGPQVGDPEGVQQAYQTDGERNRLWLTTQDYARAVKEVAEAFSIPYIDVFGSTGINPFNRSQYIADNVHPNEEGKKAIARLMIGMLDDLKPVERKP
ncbi:MAG: hypothetical protein HFI39_10215 [Lachnospiraceae bacterium]|nr:hypothetical protein [Lachnospiraceae bacterium]